MNLLIHWFTPHQSNNYKAKLLQPSGLLLFIGILLLVQLALSNVSFYPRNILGIATNMKVEDLYRLTNLERQKLGLKPLKLDQLLNQAAEEKAKNMFANNYWAHSAPDGTSPWYFFHKVGYPYRHAGENLAKEFDHSADVVSAWMVSPSHRANIVRPEYKDIGFAVVNGKLLGQETTLVVQLFGITQADYLADVENHSNGISPTTGMPQQAIDIGSSAAYIAGVTKSGPSNQFFYVIKYTSILFGFFLMGIIFFDGIILWRKRAVRLSSHNIAHILFILSVLGAIWFTTLGAIL